MPTILCLHHFDVKPTIALCSRRQYREAEQPGIVADAVVEAQHLQVRDRRPGNEKRSQVNRVEGPDGLLREAGPSGREDR